MSLSQTAHSRVQRITVAFVGTLIAATLAAGALAAGHNGADDQAGRKFSNFAIGQNGGGKPIRS
jgi:hypothetical protein